SIVSALTTSIHVCSTLAATSPLILFFFYPATPPSEIYTLSLHDALPILLGADPVVAAGFELERELPAPGLDDAAGIIKTGGRERSEEHTSELQSPYDLVCRLLLEKKKKTPCLRARRGRRRNTATHDRPLR